MKNFIFVCREAFRLWKRRKEMPFTKDEMEVKQVFRSKVYALSGVLCLVFMTFRLWNKEREREDILSEKLVFGGNSEKEKELKFIRLVNFSKMYEVVGLIKEVDKFEEEVKKKESEMQLAYSKNVPEEPSLSEK